MRDLEDGGADLVAVADADLVVAQSLDGEVLAELSVDEVVSSELAFPVAIGVDLVDEDGALLAAMPGKIALPVAVDVELAHAARAGDRVLEDAGEDRLPLPSHVLRHADVDRQQGCRPHECWSGVGRGEGRLGRAEALVSPPTSSAEYRARREANRELRAAACASAWSQQRTVVTNREQHGAGPRSPDGDSSSNTVRSRTLRLVAYRACRSLITSGPGDEPTWTVACRALQKHCRVQRKASAFRPERG